MTLRTPAPILALAACLGLAIDASASVQYLIGVEGLVGRTSADGSLAGMKARVGKFADGFTPSAANYNQWESNFVPLTAPAELVADHDTFVTATAPDSGPWMMADRAFTLTTANPAPGFVQGDPLVIWIASDTSTGPDTEAALLSHPSWSYVAPGDGPQPGVTLALYGQSPALLLGSAFQDQYLDASGESGIRLVTEAVPGAAPSPALTIEVPSGSPISSGSPAPRFAPTLIGQAGGSLLVTVRNVGEAPLGEFSVSMETEGHADDFALDMGALPGSLDPQASGSFTVAFSPEAGGPRFARLRIESNDAANSPFFIELSGTGMLGAEPANQTFANRQILGSVPFATVAGSNAGAVLEAGEIDPGGLGGASVWYEWTAPEDGWTTVHTASSDPLHDLDTVLALYEGQGTIDTIEMLGHNDESIRDEGRASRLVFQASEGTTYQIAIHGYSGQTGEFQLQIAPEPEPPLRVTALGFAPNPVDVSEDVEEFAVNVSVQSESPMFPNGGLSVELLPPGESNSGALYVDIFEDDLISGTTTTGTYGRSGVMPRYSVPGEWNLRILAWNWHEFGFIFWTAPGEDLVEDHYLMPASVASRLVVVNEGEEDASAPTIVGVSGFPAVVDVTDGEVAFDVDFVIADDLSGFASGEVSLVAKFGEMFFVQGWEEISGIDRISGDELLGTYRVTVTVPEDAVSGIYYPAVALSDSNSNSAYYSDHPDALWASGPVSPGGTPVSMQVIGRPPSPSISVEDFEGLHLTSEESIVNFGEIESGVGRTLSFEILNFGTADLEDLSLEKFGTHQSDVSFESLSSTTIPSGGRLTFEVTFAPGGGGTRSAAVHITSNDPLLSPFIINLAATGAASILPTVTTNPSVSPSATSATVEGNVTDAGSTALIERGVVYSVNAAPDLATGTKVASGTGLGAFSALLTGLAPGTTYFARAYATNSAGTAYGSEISFTTQSVGSAPNWQSPEGREHSMTVYAEVERDGVLVEAPGSLLAAFENEAVAGVTGPISGPGGITLYQLTVWSDQVALNGMPLMVYDSSTGETLDIVERIDFQSNAILGSIVAPIRFHVRPLEIDQHIPLVQGWNWISFRALPEGGPVEVALADHSAADNDLIKGVSGSATYFDGQWYPSSGFVLEPARMYMLRRQASGAGELTVRGTPFDSSLPVSVVSGWNWLGFLPEEVRSVGSALAMADLIDGDVVKSQQGGTATYFGGAWFPPSFEMAPGRGYLLRASLAHTFSYDPAGEEPDEEAMEAFAGNGGAPPHPPDSLVEMTESGESEGPSWTSPVGREHSMTVYAVVRAGDDYLQSEGSMLAVFEGDEVAGVTSLSDGPGDSKLYQMTVWSDQASGTGFSYRLYDSGTGLVREIDESLDFIADGIVGAINDPLVLTTGLVQLPVVETVSAMPIDVGIAVVGGAVTDEGGLPVSARGAVYSTLPDPELGDGTLVDAGEGPGGFSATLTGLAQGTLYYARAFATNALGTAYGESEVFVSDIEPPFGPDGRATVEEQMIFAGGVQRFHFTLLDPRELALAAEGDGGLEARILDASGAVVASFRSGAEGGFVGALTAGSYILELTNPGSEAGSFSLSFDASVAARVLPSVTVSKATLVSKRLRRVRGSAAVSNLGNLPDAMLVRGARGNRHFRVVYLSGGNVTASMRSGQFRTSELVAGGAKVGISATVTPNRRTLLRNGRTLRRNFNLGIVAVSTSPPAASDAKRIRVRTR